VVFDRKGRFLAVGLLDPDGPIRLRILSAGTPAQIGAAFFRERLQGALALRAPLLADPRTTGVRLLSGENDGMPGLVVDRYGETLVLKAYTLAWGAHLRELLPALLEVCRPRAVLLLAARRVAGSPLAPPFLREPTLLHGTLPDPWDDGGESGALPFLESGLRFEAHPLSGHKTGFYLDQRDNRTRLEARVREGIRDMGGGRPSSLRVLNAFSYTGGFSLAAARGGAAQVVSVDRSGPALRQAERHFHLNGKDSHIARARHRTVEGDAFQALEEFAEEGERFDVVVLDPPSFAREAGQVDGAVGAYQRLTRLGLRVLRPGGLLVQASCSARVGAERFHGAILAAARGEGRPLEEVERTGHPLDHPVGFPEGAYLKCLFARG
jgi:23S rRNA (cytosine1962-C5)-methyltransferase